VTPEEEKCSSYIGGGMHILLKFFLSKISKLFSFKEVTGEYELCSGE